MKKRMMCFIAVFSGMGLFMMQGFSLVAHATENEDVVPVEASSENAELVNQLNGNAGEYILGFTMDVGSVLAGVDENTQQKIRDFINQSSGITDMGDGIYEFVDPEEFRQLMDLTLEGGITEVSADKDDNADMTDPKSRLWARAYLTAGADTEDVSDDAYVLYFEKGLRGGHKGETFGKEYRADTDKGFLGSTDNAHPWSELAGNVNKVVFYQGFGEDAHLTDMSGWFSDFTALTEVEGITSLNTTDVTSIEGLFSGCTSLTYVDMSGMNISGAVDTMFEGCENLKSVDLNNATISSSSINSMFAGMTNLESISFKDADASAVSDFGSMFAGCENLTDINLEGFKTSGAVNMNCMFEGCKGLERLDIRDFETGAVIDMAGMFAGCENIKEIYVGEGFSTDSVQSGDDMFAGCELLVGANGTAYDEEHTGIEYARVDGAQYQDNEDGTYSYIEGDYGYFRNDVDAEEPTPITKDNLVELDLKKEDAAQPKEKPEEDPENETDPDGNNGEEPDDGLSEEPVPEENGNSEENPNPEENSNSEDSQNSDENGNSEGNQDESQNEGEGDGENSGESSSDGNGADEGNSDEGGSEGNSAGGEGSEDGSSGQDETEIVDETESDESSSDEDPSDDAGSEDSSLDDTASEDLRKE